jgi:hypothetical protein
MITLKIMPIYRKWKWLSVGFLETIISNKLFNPCTGGCYDGLEEDYINLNQYRKSYLMADLQSKKCRREMQYNKTNTLHSHNHSLIVAN